MLAMYWIQFEEIKGIVHPSHHPFHSKTQSTRKGWLGNAWPVGGFFGDGLYIGEITKNGFIKIFN